MNKTDPSRRPTALVADDEPLLRERLVALLGKLWPELQVVVQARNGREAIELFDQHAPSIVFLDIHMPGLSGVDVARSIGSRARIVFVTAHEQYAVQAFEQGAVDYLVKPFEEQRLAQALVRLREPASVAPAAAAQLEPMLDALAARLRQTATAPQFLQWIKASVGQSVRLIPVDEIVFMRSDEKYTLVVWQGGESLIRKTIRELADELDPARFLQIHRSVIVALPQISQVTRGANETAEVHLRGRPEVLPVSRSYVHQFRQM
jgi:DNA-binding LytR/AlgR family response regulator